MRHLDVNTGLLLLITCQSLLMSSPNPAYLRLRTTGNACPRQGVSTGTEIQILLGAVLGQQKIGDIVRS